MTTSEGTGSRKSRYTLDEFATKLQEFMTSRGCADKHAESDSSDDCVIEVTDTTLNVCCPVTAADGHIEIECTDVLDILNPKEP